MKTRFADALAFVLRPDNDGQGLHVTPHDPGGATNHGITYATWRGWCDMLGERSMSALSVFSALTDGQIAAFYRAVIWNPLQCDGLPPGVDLVAFNFACGSNTLRAARFMQGLLGVVADGQIGPVTLAAAASVDSGALVDMLSARDDAFYASLTTFRIFGRGWDRRAEDCRALAHQWIVATPTAAAVAVAA